LTKSESSKKRFRKNRHQSTLTYRQDSGTRARPLNGHLKIIQAFIVLLHWNNTQIPSMPCLEFWCKKFLSQNLNTVNSECGESGPNSCDGESPICPWDVVKRSPAAVQQLKFPNVQMSRCPSPFREGVRFQLKRAGVGGKTRNQLARGRTFG
jgi:hypothetical protein